MNKYDIVTIGDASEDIFVRPKDMTIVRDSRFVTGMSASFELGEKIELEDVEYQVGGSACNNAVAFSRQGFKTAAIIALGKDTPGEKVEEKLVREKVHTEFIKIRQSYKTNFSIVFNIGNERTIFVYHGLDDYSCLKAPKDLRTNWIFLAPLGPKSDDIINRVVTLKAEKNVRVAWNPGTRQIRKTAQHFRQLLSCTDILFLNREEAIKFANFPVPPRAPELMKALYNYGTKVVVITDGKKGADAFDGMHFYHADIIESDKVDATGAGDSFASGFIGRLIPETDYSHSAIMEALAWGVVNSTSVVSYVGAQKGLLNRQGIIEEIENNHINIEMD